MAFDITSFGGLTPLTQAYPAFDIVRFGDFDETRPTLGINSPGESGSYDARQAFVAYIYATNPTLIERFVIMAEHGGYSEVVYDGDALTTLYNEAGTGVVYTPGSYGTPDGYQVTFKRRGGFQGDLVLKLMAYGIVGNHRELSYTITGISGTAGVGGIAATGTFSLANQVPATNGRDIAIDFVNKKWVLENRDFVFTKGANAIKQSLELRLMFLLGEWFLDQNLGTAWYQAVFTKPFNQTAAEDMLRARILGTKGIRAINSFSLVRDRAARTISITYNVSSDFGQLTNTIKKVG